MTIDPGAVATRPRPHCPLCGSEGARVYADLRDDLFGAPGVWGFRRCANAEACDLLWLDPAPEPSAFPALYRAYYTHHTAGARPSSAKGERAWLALARPYQALLRLTPVARMRAEREALWLGGRVPGRLLDVGCGDGAWLARMRSAGWDVRGQELDARAAETARAAHGIDVFVGELADAGFPAAHFDAVTMSHVIEHALDPVALLRECARVVRPGGALVAVTPNTRSLSHAAFGRDWRGLEPARHIQVFGPRSLALLASAAGLAGAVVATTPVRAQYMHTASAQLRARRRGRGEPPYAVVMARAVAFELRAWQAFFGDRDSGEELALRASP